MTTKRQDPDLILARRQHKATRIGDWVLHPDLGVLRGSAREVRLNPKALHVLLVLLDAGDKGVSREALLDQVWGENYPTDSVISRAMADLRSAFGESAGEQKYIRTLPKFGYQFVAEHSEIDEDDSSSNVFAKPLVDSRRMMLAIAIAVLVIAALAMWRTSSRPDQSPLVLTGARPLTSAPGASRSHSASIH